MLPWISALFLALGSLLLLLSSIGIVRLPDFYMRMSGASKASGAGTLCMLLAAAFHFADWAIAGRALAVGLFVFFTIPVSAQFLGRAAYRSGVPFWRKTWRNDLPEKPRQADKGEP